jgi:hypothetical protein
VKTNNPCDVADYRPISALPALSKAVEMIMKRQITGHIENNPNDELLPIGVSCKT